MQDRIKELICVDGNRYYTPYGFYTCIVKASQPQRHLVKVKVRLTSESDTSEPKRVYRITGTLQAIMNARVKLVIDIHKWAMLDRDEESYWEKKVQI
jgi:hypothetical protein